MKLKGIDILNLSEVFSFLSSKEMGLNTAVTIVNNIKTLSTSKDIIDNKRNKLISEYALKENGEIATNSDGSIKGFSDKTAFESELNKLLFEDVDIENLKPVFMNALSDIAISPQMIAVLMQFDLLKEE